MENAHLYTMKTMFVSIYSQEELRLKLKQTEAFLKKVKDEVYDPRFCDYNLLYNIWFRYESTMYIISRSILKEGNKSLKRSDSHSLYVAKEVEDNFSDEWKDYNYLRNGLSSIRSLYDSIDFSLKYNTYNLVPSFLQGRRELIKEIASDVMRHFNANSFDRQKILDILEHLNYHFLKDTDIEKVSYEEVLDHAIINKLREEKNLDDLILKLDLVEE